MRIVSLLPLLLFVTACASTASGDEYGMYRAYRYSVGRAARTSTARDYLQSYPNGPHAAEAYASLEGTDDGYWEDHHGSAAQLNDYLQAYPTGDHALEARRRLARLGSNAFRGGESASIDTSGDPSAAPRALFAAWFGVATSLHGWNQPISAFYGANPGFSATFNTSPAPRCEPGACVKLLRASCTAHGADGTASPGGSPFAFRLLARGPRVVGADLVFQRSGFALWRSCETGAPWHADSIADDADVDWAFMELETAVRAMFPGATPTPAVLSGASLDVADPGPTPSEIGRVRWSLVAGCDESSRTQGTQSCLRIDGFESASIGGDIGIRIWAIPSQVIEGLAFQLSQATSGTQGLPAPPTTSAGGALPNAGIATTTDSGETTFMPVLITPAPRERPHFVSATPDAEHSRMGDTQAVPGDGVFVVSTGDPVDIVFVPTGEFAPSGRSGEWACRTRCFLHLPIGSYRLVARSAGGSVSRNVAVNGREVFRIRPARSDPLSVGVMAVGSALAVVGMIGLVIGLGPYSRLDSTWAGICASSGLAGLAGIIAGGVAGARSSGRITQLREDFSRGDGRRRALTLVSAGAAPVEGGAVTGLGFAF